MVDSMEYTNKTHSLSAWRGISIWIKTLVNSAFNLHTSGLNMLVIYIDSLTTVTGADRTESPLFKIVFLSATYFRSL